MFVESASNISIPADPLDEVKTCLQRVGFKFLKTREQLPPDAEEDPIHTEVKRNYRVIQSQNEKSSFSLLATTATKTKRALLCTFAAPAVLAGLTFCISLNHAFEGRDNNQTFLFATYPIQKFLRFAGVVAASLLLKGPQSVTNKEIIIIVSVSLIFTLAVWSLLL